MRGRIDWGLVAVGVVSFALCAFCLWAFWTGTDFAAGYAE